MMPVFAASIQIAQRVFPDFVFFITSKQLILKIERQSYVSSDYYPQMKIVDVRT
jgi:hypothetical protein